MANALERAGRNGLARLVGILFPSRRLSPEAVRDALAKKKAPKILLVRPHQGLGDLLLATPIFRGLKQHYPFAQLHFLADAYNAKAVRTNPHLSHVWVWDKRQMRGLFSMWKFFHALRTEKFDMAIIVSSRVPSFTSFLLAKASGARIVWAYSTQPFYDGAVWSKWLTNVELPPPREDDPEFDKFMGLITPLGASTSFETEFYVPNEDRAAAKVAWSKIPSRAPRVGLFLAGNPDRPERLWPIESWIMTAIRLERELGASVIAISTPKALRSGSGAPEPGFYEEVAKHLPFRLELYNDPSMWRVTAFLQGLNLFFVPDGGLFHMAAAAKVPTVGLFITTDPNKWAPPMPWVSTLWGKGNAAAITVDMVVAHARERLLAHTQENLLEI